MQCDTKQALASDGTLVHQSATLSQLTGDEKHPANAGKLCVKGSHLLDTTSNKDKLLYPAIDGERSSWDEATTKIADHIKDCIERYGPESIAFYLSGQLLTEDYYVANKLMKGFIGSANVDTNSRLCMSSAVAAYKRALGADAVPCCYEDLDETELLVLVGSNAAWTHPVLFQRMQKALQADTTKKLVVIDPRVTPTSQSADIHLAIKPGTDAWIYNGLLSYLVSTAQCDTAYIQQHTQDFDACIEDADLYTLDKVANAAQVSSELLLSFYSMFANAKSAISFYSMGINQSSSGVDKAHSIINCHLATGKIGKVGSGPFSITGQPNAMGGREVGGLANMLAAHMDIDNKEHNQLVETFWQAPNMVQKVGLKAVDMFDGLASGKIKFIWIMGTNPVVSMPNRNQVEAALSKCDMVVVSDIVERNDTIAFADIVLPATGWSEKDGTVTNSERCISRQRGILPLQGECKHDWQIINEVAAKLGFGDAFSYAHSGEIFNEHAKLSGFENKGQRDFDISGLSELTREEFDKLQPIQWPVNAKAPLGTKRLFTDARFYTPNGLAKFFAIKARLPEQQTSSDYPFALNTGRMRDQWHTMTRTGSAKSLSEHTQQAELLMHPDAAKSLHLKTGDLVALRSAHCTNNPVILPVNISLNVRKNELFAPIHWSKTNTSHGALAKLFTSANDPISGQPELKHAAVSCEKVALEESATLLINKALVNDDIQLSEYQVRINLGEAWLFYMHRLPKKLSEQGDAVALKGKEFVSALQCNSLAEQIKQNIQQQSLAIAPAWLFKQKQSTQAYLGFVDDALSAHFVSIKEPASQSENTLATAINPEFSLHCLASASLEGKDQALLLNASFPSEYAKGKVICSCFNVRKNEIQEAIASGCNSVNALGNKLKCGTNCGSCKSELSELINLAEPINSSKPNDRKHNNLSSTIPLTVLEC